MKPFVQKLPLSENMSFVAQTFRTPYFEEGWHQHEEYELILFTEGSGKACIGNYEGQYETGNIYFLGSNLPHYFKKSSNQPTSAIVIHFRDDCWGMAFINMPECRPIRHLLQQSGYGLTITDKSRQRLQPLIKALEPAADEERIILLLQCLHVMARAKEYVTLSTKDIPEVNQYEKEWIDRIFKYTIETFREPVTLPQVAAVAYMSVPSFCHYFKRRTQKTFINFLNEVRVGYACNQLLETNKPVTDICYESGYNTVAHFHRQFLRLKKTTPLQYRKACS